MSWSFLSTLWGCYWAVYIPAKPATAIEKKAHLPSILAATPILKILCTLDKGHHGCPSCLHLLGNLAIPGRENGIRVEFEILHVHSIYSFLENEEEP